MGSIFKPLPLSFGFSLSGGLDMDNNEYPGKTSTGSVTREKAHTGHTYFVMHVLRLKAYNADLQKTIFCIL